MIKAQNPIVQTHFAPDPAPMIHNGTLYAYVGDDIPGFDFYCMTKWRVLSTTDMVNWTDYGSPITLESFKWARDRAWASQCIERNGKFYWYICAQTTKNDMAIGVAVSHSPTGPFKDALGKPLITNGSWSNIGVLVSKALIDFPEKANVKVNFEDIGIKGQAKVRDLWSHKDLGIFNGSFSRELSQHGAGLFQITPLR